MTAGLSANNFAAATLNVLRNVTFTGVATVYLQLHVGDPGANGTANVSALTTRNAITWNSPSAGSMTLNTLSNFTMTATETISYISLWSASTSGTFYWSAALTSSVAVVNGSTLSFSSATLGFSPIAA